MPPHHGLAGYHLPAATTRHHPPTPEPPKIQRQSTLTTKRRNRNRSFQQKPTNSPPYPLSNQRSPHPTSRFLSLPTMNSIIRLARPLLVPRISPLSQRTFSCLSPLRPTLTSTFRPNNSFFTPSPTAAAASPAETSTADVVPKTALSMHPSLQGAMQLRFGPRNTMNGHTRLVQKRRHGWLKRTRSKTGRRILQRRKLKGRRHVAW